MKFGLFDTWNAIYAGGKVPWEPEYVGGKLLEREAYALNFEQIDAIESGLDLPTKTLDRTRKHLREIGNLSSTSVLVLLDECLNGPLPEIAGKSCVYRYE